MTTSPLTTTCDALADGVTARLTTAGFPWDRLHKSWERYLGETLGAMTSGHPELTMGRSEILAAILGQLGGTGDARTMSEATLMAGIIDASGGGGGGYTGPLDILSSAVVAYSLRALSASWVSDAITIREDVHDTTMSFTTTASNAVDVAAVTAFLNGANGFATAWLDQSGNAKDGVQATSGAQPQWSGSGPNSRPCLIADGNRILIPASNVVLPGGAYTTFFVMRQDAQTSSAGNVWGVNTDYTAYVTVSAGATGDLSANSVQLDAFSDPNEAGGASATFSGADQFTLYDVAWKFGSHSYYVNGVSLSEVTDRDSGGDVVDITQPLAILANSTTDGPGGGVVGAVCELIIYSGIISDSNRALIRQNIAAYYGITLS